MKKLNKGARFFIYFTYLLFLFLLILLIITKPYYIAQQKGIYHNFILPMLFIVAITLSDLFPIIYPIGSENIEEITISYALNFSIAFLFPPLTSLLIGSFAGGFLPDVFRKKPWYKALFNSSYIGIAVGLTSLVFHAYWLGSSPFFSPRNILTLFITVVVYLLTESLILFYLLAKLNEKPFFIFWISNVKKFTLEIISLFPLGIIIIYLIETNPIMVLLLLPVFISVHSALSRRVAIIKETEDTLFALADAVDARIPDTMNHTHRVAKLSENLCNKLKLPTNLTNEIAIASSLHDIGKISIPDAVLNKKGKLTKKEYEIIKKHSEEGAKIASKLSLFREGAKLIKHHHERYDGKGYPDGLKGEKIPFGARVINIADSFDTMTTPRNYRPYTKSIQEALEEVERCKGTQFDPQISDAFIDMVKSDLEKYTELIKLREVTENN
jgi:putative nucleotidyltransferase with HDIG domain